MADAPLTRLHQICRALPEVRTEGDRHVGFSVRGRRFAWYVDDHHGDGRLTLACKGAPGVNEGLAATDPARYCIPAYPGPKGWVGVWLDVEDVDWDEVRLLVMDAYRLVAPKTLARRAG